MARLTPLWMQGNVAGYPATLDRRLLGALWPNGGVTGMAVTAAGASMNLNIAIGAAAVPDATVTGAAYLCPSDAVESVTLAAAPPSGQDRIDVVTVQPREGANIDWIVNVVQGTASATPVAPTVPAGQLALAQVRVTGGSASVSQAQITDLRGGGLTGSGAPSTPLAAGAALSSYTDPSGRVWVAKGGVNGGAWRRAVDALHVRCWRNGAFNVGNTPLTMDATTAADDPYGLWSTASGTLVVPVPGLWLVNARMGVTPSAAGTWAMMFLIRTGSASTSLAGPTAHAASTAGLGAPVNTSLRCAVGDVLSFSMNGSGTGATNPSNTYATLDYIGNG